MAPQAEAEVAGEGLVQRLRRGLARTREGWVGRIEALLAGKQEIGAEVLEEMEEILLGADLGVRAAGELIEGLRGRLASSPRLDSIRVREDMKAEVLRILGTGSAPAIVHSGRPHVIMVVGVNGVGKTTTIAKLAHLFRTEGERVTVAAADTFRAAAIEQLEAWAERAGAEVVKQKEGADPGAVAYDGLRAARTRHADVLIVDTAGRLHTKTNLMEELKKVKRVLGREMGGAPHEVLLVLDATTGQNALSQARLFNEALGLTGIVLAKLDGTAKGGIVVAIQSEMGIPIRYVGIGEGMEDLKPFVAESFVQALF